MRTYPFIAAGVAAIALSGCVSYPVYQPVPIARLTPAQSAALASRPIDPAERDRYAAANAQVQQDDQASLAAQQQAQVLQPYAYAYPGYPAYYPYGGFYGGYPYYGGFYPGLSLSFGYRGGYRGGFRGGYHGGGGFHGHR